MFFGLVLVFLGGILLLKQMGIIHNWSFWSYIWPVLIIAIGIKLIVDKQKQHP